MDKRVLDCIGVSAEEMPLLEQVEAGMPLTADVSRADLLLCCLLDESQALVARHIMPKSASSLYRTNMTGHLLTAKEQPLLFRALKSGSSGQGQKETLSNGAPVIQDAYPICNGQKQVVGALLFETNMLAYERQKRRNRAFRQAVRWLQEMCLHGELGNTATLSRFGLYDGVYLVDRSRKIVYMSGIAANLFRSVGIVTEIREQGVASLEALDVDIVEQAFRTHKPAEVRRESEDGRIWVRTALPLRMPMTLLHGYWHNWSWPGLSSRSEDGAMDAVLVMVHNATEAVQKQRELNVKSAIIQEVHHRVKNNLQTIAAILRIQSRRMQEGEAKQALVDAVNRILSMSVIHEFLSQDEHRAINVRDVCSRVVTQVQQVAASPEQAVEIKISGPSIRLPAGQATPTALVMNELLLNAMEHGVSERPTGTISIELVDLGDAVSIVVEDDGAGLPEGFDVGSSESLGLQIVRTLVMDDLKGQLEMEPARPADGDAESNGAAGTRGTRVRVTFPKRTIQTG